MDTHYTTQLKGVIVGLLLIAVALGGPLGTVSAQSGPVVSVGDATVDTGETATVAVTLSEAPEGVAGFEIVVSVGDTATATPTDVSIPESWGITDTNVSESEATIEAIDVDENVQPGATDITLGTLTLQGDADGETALSVEVVKFDDDEGNRIEPATRSGTLTVTGDEAPTETATSSDNDDDGGSSGGAIGDDSSADGGDTNVGGNSGTDSSDGDDSSGTESTTSDGSEDSSSDGDSESTTTGTAVRDDGSSNTNSDSDDSTATTTEPADASNSTLRGDTEQSMVGGLPIQGGLGIWVGLVALLLFATGIGVVTVRRNRNSGPETGGASTTDAGPDATATGTTPSDAAEALSTVGDELTDRGITVIDLQAGQSANTLTYATAAANDNAAMVEIRTIVRAYASAADGPLGHKGLEATICRDDETLGTWHLRSDWLEQLEKGALSMEALDEKVFETLSRTS